MDRFSDMKLFLAVIDAGGLAAGGRRLGLSPASVSERIAALEARTGARLLVRTTRSLGLTDEGRAYAETARSVLAEIDDLDTRLREGAEQISGHIRIGAPLDLGRNRIAVILDDFMVQNPGISIELILSDGFTDLVTESLDFAIRYGRLADSGQMVRKLADSRRVACASPAYLDRHGSPAIPSDLVAHHCLIMLFGSRPDNRWQFQQDGQVTTVTVRGRRVANDGELIRRWAIEGHGIAMKSIRDIEKELKNGTLIELLPAFAISDSALQIVYPAGRPLPRRSRTLIDFFAEHFRQEA